MLFITDAGKFGPRAILSSIKVIAVADAAIMSIGEMAMSVPGITPASRSIMIECAKLKPSKIIKLDPVRQNSIINFLMT